MSAPMTAEQAKARVLAYRRHAAAAEERGWIRWRLGDIRGAVRCWMAAANSTIAAHKLTKGGS